MLEGVATVPFLDCFLGGVSWVPITRFHTLVILGCGLNPPSMVTLRSQTILELKSAVGPPGNLQRVHVPPGCGRHRALPVVQDLYLVLNLLLHNSYVKFGVRDLSGHGHLLSLAVLHGRQMLHQVEMHQANQGGGRMYENYQVDPKVGGPLRAGRPPGTLEVHAAVSLDPVDGPGGLRVDQELDLVGVGHVNVVEVRQVRAELRSAIDEQPLLSIHVGYLIGVFGGRRWRRHLLCLNHRGPSFLGYTCILFGDQGRGPRGWLACLFYCRFRPWERREPIYSDKTTHSYVCYLGRGRRLRAYPRCQCLRRRNP